MPVMTESPSCYFVWVFLILTIALAICGIVGCCVACCTGGASGKPGRDDVEMQWNPRECRMEPVARPPPPPKHWSSEERRALSLVVSGLPPSCLPDVRSIVGGDESDALFRLRWPAALHSVDYASLDVSVCDRLQQYVDAQPSRAGKQGEICVLSGIALVCVVPAFCGFWFFAIRCAFSTP